MTTVEDPVETADPHGHGSRIDHPAFAQIAASRVRCAGGEILYGSDFPHQNFVSIRICRSSLNRDLSNDWHYGKDQMMEVNMSEAQWATRSEEQTSEIQSLMRNSYDVLCWKNKTKKR